MRPDFIYYFLRWVGGFCDIIDGVIVIFTLGFYNPMISFKIVYYSARRNLKRRIECQNSKEGRKTKSLKR